MAVLIIKRNAKLDYKLILHQAQDFFLMTGFYFISSILSFCFIFFFAPELLAKPAEQYNSICVEGIVYLEDMQNINSELSPKFDKTGNIVTCKK